MYYACRKSTDWTWSLQGGVGDLRVKKRESGGMWYFEFDFVDIGGKDVRWGIGTDEHIFWGIFDERWAGIGWPIEVGSVYV